MSTFNVILTFRDTRVVLPDEDVLLPGLPSKGDLIWTTPKFLDDEQEQNDWETAISWEVDSVQMLFKHPHRTEALVTLVPYTGEPKPSLYQLLGSEVPPDAQGIDLRGHIMAFEDDQPLVLTSRPFTELPIASKVAVLKEMGFKVREGYIFDESSEIEWQVVPRSQETEGDALVVTWHEDA